MKKNTVLKSIGHNIQLARLKKVIHKKFLQKNVMSRPNISVHQKLGLSSGSIPLIIDICNLLDITPNYIFKKALNTSKLNDSLEIISPETLIYYEKLKDENKKFINNTIKNN